MPGQPDEEPRAAPARLEVVSPSDVKLEPVARETKLKEDPSCELKSISVREPTPARRPDLRSVMKVNNEASLAESTSRYYRDARNDTPVTPVAGEDRDHSSWQAKPRIARSVKVQTPDEDGPVPTNRGLNGPAGESAVPMQSICEPAAHPWTSRKSIMERFTMSIEDESHFGRVAHEAT